ncbi:MAG: hypothetical protein O6952_09750 [Planctomycetota bacterium]|nr:hypothetical protein [Planctomycetota bacterium]
MPEHTREQLEEMEWDDFDEDGDEERPEWMSKAENPTGGFSKLHVVDLNKIEDGDERKNHAIYGVPVGWEVDDAPAPELNARILEVRTAEDDGEEAFAKALDKYGFLDEDHFLWVSGLVEDAISESPEAMQALVNAQMASMKQTQQDALAGAQSGDIAPVEGITMDQYAQTQAKIAQGADLDKSIAELKIERPQWDRVCAEWEARMKRDTTGAIMTAYGQAFAGAGVGQFAGAGAEISKNLLDPQSQGVGGDEPIPFERWIEVSEAQSAASQQGVDASTVLKNYGMTPADWGTAAGWWGQQLAQNAMNADFMENYNKLSEQYREKFSAGSADADIEF